MTHSDLNANGCCEETTQESCSLNPVTPRTCTPTCDGTCESDGSCRPNCETGYSYDETAGQCCADLTEIVCHELTPATPGFCPKLTFLSMDATSCTTTDGIEGKCRDGVCEPLVTASCDEGTIITGLNNSHEYCVSDDAMDWYNASTWCEARGRHLASMDEMCPGWDGETGSDKCANLYDIGAPDSWSSQTFNSSEAYSVRSGNETVTHDYRDDYLKAFCY